MGEQKNANCHQSILQLTSRSEFMRHFALTKTKYYLLDSRSIEQHTELLLQFIQTLFHYPRTLQQDLSQFPCHLMSPKSALNMKCSIPKETEFVLLKWLKLLKRLQNASLPSQSLIKLVKLLVRFTNCKQCSKNLRFIYFQQLNVKISIR